MKIFELINELESYAAWDRDKTCDNIICGNADDDITSVGVTMFPTTEVIKNAVKMNINCLITHEPLFYRMEDGTPHETGQEKLRILEENGITVYRFHDRAHAMTPDLIAEGQLKLLNLSGKLEKHGNYGGAFNAYRFLLDKPMTAKELAMELEKNLGVEHIRIAGCTDKKGRYIYCCFGAGGYIEKELRTVDFVITGELCEWREAELARDYAQQGANKAILVMGHQGSEYGGMKLLAERLDRKHKEFKTIYINDGAVYSYTDCE